MTITQKIIGVAFGLFCVLGSVHAATVTCGDVTGALLVGSPPGADIEFLSSSPIECSGNALFNWDGNDGFKVTATLANVGTSNMTIDLTMFTGESDTAGFGTEAFWSFTLNGFVFNPTTIDEIFDDFVNGVVVGFENDNRTANFTMGAPPELGYPAGVTFTASYSVRAEEVNGVPEPGTWHLVLASLGVLALTGRRSRSTRRRLAA